MAHHLGLYDQYHLVAGEPLTTFGIVTPDSASHHCSLSKRCIHTLCRVLTMKWQWCKHLCPTKIKSPQNWWIWARPGRQTIILLDGANCLKAKLAFKISDFAIFGTHVFSPEPSFQKFHVHVAARRICGRLPWTGARGLATLPSLVPTREPKPLQQLPNRGGARSASQSGSSREFPLLLLLLLPAPFC